MRLCIKKIYCDSCQKLVRGREQRVDSHTHILCSKCSRLLWVREGVTWRYMRGGD